MASHWLAASKSIEHRGGAIWRGLCRRRDISTAPPQHRRSRSLFRLGGLHWLIAFLSSRRVSPPQLCSCSRLSSAYASVRVAAFGIVSRVRRLAATAVALCSGAAAGRLFCPTRSVPPRIDMPPAYRAGPRNADAACRRSSGGAAFAPRNSPTLIEESLTSNLDIAAAVARIVQADAQARIAGAALLPVVDLNGGATRSRSSQTTGSGGGGGRRFGRAHELQRLAERELRDRLLGQEPRGAARRPRNSPSPAASTARWWR